MKVKGGLCISGKRAILNHDKVLESSFKAGWEAIAESSLKQRRSRMLLPILLLHLIVIPLFIYQFLIRFEKSHLQVQKALGESFARELQGQVALNQVLSGGDPHQVQKTVNHVSKEYQLQGMRVYDNQGRLRASSGEIIGEVHEFTDDVTIEPGSGEGVMIVTRLVKNQSVCHSCHDSSQENIGLIQAAFPIGNYAVQFKEERTRAVLTAIIILGVVFSLILLFHHYFVSTPVRKITKAMTRVRKGDLSAQVPSGRKDELGVIAESFNRVVESLQQARSELERRHQADMNRAEQLATVGEIAAGLAHEVKNPIAGIESALEVVVSETDEKWQHREVLEQMIGETRRITAIINRLLDYARAREPRPDWYDVELIVGDIKSIFMPQALQRRVSFNISMDKNTGRMFVDANELKQVLINVLRNSLEVLDSGGRIDVAVNTTEDHVTFVLSDNGPGMDPLTRSRIFQPFYTTKPGGTGLGLSIVHRIVEGMGGAVEVESELSRGTTFTIVLPRESRCENTDH